MCSVTHIGILKKQIYFKSKRDICFMTPNSPGRHTSRSYLDKYVLAVVGKRIKLKDIVDNNNANEGMRMERK